MTEQPTPNPTDTPALVPMEQVLNMLAGMKEISAQSAEDIQANILADYLNAASLDDLLAQGTTVAAQDVLGLPITVTGVKWNESKVKNGPPVYAVITAVGDGKPLTITCGSMNVMTQLYKAADAGWLPFDGVIDELAYETQQGYRPMFFRAAVPDDKDAWKAKAAKAPKGAKAKPAPDEEAF